MEDRWIPRDNIQHPLGCKLPDCPLLVKDLLVDGGGAWDEQRLRTLFYDYDVKDILRTRVGREGSNNFLAWNHTKTGIFSVKSAYHLAIQLKRAQAGMLESSRSCVQHKGRLALWETNVPGKVKIHF
jgi:hypothetical protein